LLSLFISLWKFKSKLYGRNNDTTLRDGEQTSGVSFSAQEKLSIARMLLQEMCVDRIEIASARVSEGELYETLKKFVIGPQKQ
jgi:isopropylmalate/homocitrate/citramalate synthase